MSAINSMLRACDNELIESGKLKRNGLFPLGTFQFDVDKLVHPDRIAEWKKLVLDPKIQWCEETNIELKILTYYKRDYQSYYDEISYFIYFENQNIV